MRKLFVFLLAVLLAGALAIGVWSNESMLCSTNISVDGSTELLESFNQEQLDNLTLINNYGIRLGLGTRDRAIAISVAIQESRARNLSYGDRDSLGLFQQRPEVKAWGTAEQIRDPVHATKMFYEALMRVEGRAGMDPLTVALRVQRPDPAAYNSPDNRFTDWWDDALEFIRRAEAGSDAPSAAKARNAATSQQIAEADFCSGDFFGLGGVDGPAPGKLLVPVKNPRVTSEFGMRFHPILRVDQLHTGIDFGEPTGTPIYAAADGWVKSVEFRSRSGNATQIDHGGGLETAYYHQSRFAPGIQPGREVKAGQLIGYVGSTGLSKGPHLHFIVYESGTPVNPRRYLDL